MRLDPAACYRVMLARDASYDGRFFTCVKTTGIYCRPICPARPPKFENCTFVPTAAAAHEAGFRPCLRCRPESSPDLAAWRGTSATVSRALSLIENGALDDGDVGALAERLGIGDRQLRRLFRRHLGATPLSVAQTRRILLAKQLVHETDLPMIQVALASGFSSVRRFNETFKQLYDRPPSQLRRQNARSHAVASGLRLLLPYRPPYDWAAMIGFLAAHALPGVEHVTADTYSRVIDLDGKFGSLEIAHAAEASALRVTLRFSHLPAVPGIIARLRRVFDLGADPKVIAAELGRDELLAPLVAARPGLRVPGAWDGFEVAVRAVVGQRITVPAARRLGGRLVAALGQRVADDPATTLTHAFPRPRSFTADVVASLGLSRASAGALVDLAAAADANPLLFDRRSDVDEAVVRLKTLARIGKLNAQYIAMRALCESDAFFADDTALLRALANCGTRSTAAELSARADRWRPWRAYAVLHLWTGEADRRAGVGRPAARTRQARGLKPGMSVNR